MRHIALLHYSVPPVVGGVESVLARHARLLQRAGHHVRIIAARGEPLSPQIEWTPLPLIDSRHPRVLALKADLDRGRVPLEFEPLVADILRDLRAALQAVDILIAHNVCSLNKNLALTAAIQRLSLQPDRLRVILWHHDLAATTPRYQAELHPGYPWDLLRTAWGARHVVVSDLRQQELAALMHLPPAAIAVVPNGLDIADFFRLTAETQALLPPIEWMQAAPILLLPVRITPRKNIELALRVLAELRRTLPGARLIVTGPPGAHNAANDAYFEQLRQLRHQLNLTDAAVFLAERTTAYVPDDVIADCYRLADALFLPSREEGFGIPLLEAALARLPVFCTAIPPLRALGGADVTYFSPDDEPRAIAAQLAHRLSSDRAYQLAARVRAGYSWDQIYARHIAPLVEVDA